MPPRRRSDARGKGASGPPLGHYAPRTSTRRMRTAVPSSTQRIAASFVAESSLSLWAWMNECGR